jgi:hypothetical protein
MIDIEWPSETLAQYKVYTLCCHELLNSYEELAEACDIDALVERFDAELQLSYCGDHFELAVKEIEHRFQRLADHCIPNTAATTKPVSIHRAIVDGASTWDFKPALADLRDIGKGLAQEFYREGNRDTNLDLIDSNSPPLILSNQCLSEIEPSRYKEPRPISTFQGSIHLPFLDYFGFVHYLSYPVLFLHEYVSHVYTPRIDSRTFEDGWLMYAMELFMKTRWPQLCSRYPLICPQINVLHDVWKPHFTRLTSKGYVLAENVKMWIGDEHFFRFTWDLASYPSNMADHFSFHDDFLNSVRAYVQSKKGQLLRSAAESSSDALELYERIRPGM